MTGALQRPAVPREHGAWGILLVPFATAAGVAGVFDVKLALLLASVLLFMFARASFLAKRWGWAALLAGASAAGAAPLVIIWKLWWLATFGAMGAAVAVRPTRRESLAQLAAVGGMTLTAPAAWYTATGALDATAWWLWCWNALYFVGGWLYVRMRIAPVALRKQRRGPVIGFFCGLLLFVLALAWANVFSYGLLLAFTPAVTRAAFGVGRLAEPLRIKRLGWSEVALSALFGALLVWAMRT
jgi:hypothetical protein